MVQTTGFTVGSWIVRRAPRPSPHPNPPPQVGGREFQLLPRLMGEGWDGGDREATHQAGKKNLF